MTDYDSFLDLDGQNYEPPGDGWFVAAVIVFMLGVFVYVAMNPPSHLVG